MIFKSYIQLVCPDARQTDGRTAGGYNSPTSLVVWAWKIARTLHWLVSGGGVQTITFPKIQQPDWYAIGFGLVLWGIGIFRLSTLVNVPFFFSKSLKLINAKQHFDGGQCDLQKRTSTISLIICSLSLFIDLLWTQKEIPMLDQIQKPCQKSFWSHFHLTIIDFLESVR